MDTATLIQGLLKFVGAVTILRLSYLGIQELRGMRKSLDEITDQWFKEHEYREGKRR